MPSSDDTSVIGKHLNRLLSAMRRRTAERPAADGAAVADTQLVEAPARIEHGPALPTLGTDIRGDWCLTEQLGRGAFGTVFAARHQRLPREDAIKFLHPHLAQDDELRERFRNEANAMAQVRGEHLVHVYDYDEHVGLPFLVMERLFGESLQALLGRGPLDIGRFRNIASGLVRGLAQVHDAGIIHRDIKPANLFVLATNDWVKLLDFGLARTTARLTQRGVTLGTPLYMAPELFISPDAEASPQTDIYSVGVVLYEALTGSLPFPVERGDGLPAVLRRIAISTPTPPSTLRGDIPKDLDEVVLACLSKEPKQRPRTAEALAVALKERGTARSTVEPGNEVFGAYRNAAEGGPETGQHLGAMAPLRRKIITEAKSQHSLAQELLVRIFDIPPRDMWQQTLTKIKEEEETRVSVDATTQAVDFKRILLPMDLELPVFRDLSKAFYAGILVPDKTPCIRIPHRDIVTIGKHADCHVQIDDGAISRLHATLDRNHVLKDLSSNGIRVNGLRVARCTLYDGDIIALGLKAYYFLGRSHRYYEGEDAATLAMDTLAPASERATFRSSLDEIRRFILRAAASDVGCCKITSAYFCSEDKDAAAREIMILHLRNKSTCISVFKKIKRTCMIYTKGLISLKICGGIAEGVDEAATRKARKRLEAARLSEDSNPLVTDDD